MELKYRWGQELNGMTSAFNRTAYGIEMNF